jgi:hypothetical protein
MPSPPAAPPVPDRPPGRLTPGCIAMLAAATASLFLCMGVITVAVYSLRNPSLLPPSLQRTLEQSSLLNPVAAQPTWDGNDWWTQRVLSQVYTVALDAVVANEEVIARLGDDVGPDYAVENLYRRTNTGPLQATETFEFDLIGSKGNAEVTVTTGGGGMSDLQQQVQFREITVTFADGSTLNVPPPADEAIQIR